MVFRTNWMEVLLFPSQLLDITETKVLVVSRQRLANGMDVASFCSDKEGAGRIFKYLT